MSTSGLKWGNVSTQDIGATAAQLMRYGSDTMSKGFDGLTGVAKDIIGERSRVANGNALSAIMGVTDPNELNAMGQQLMQNGGPEMDKAALFQALNEQKKGLLANQNTQLSNTMLGKEVGAFDEDKGLDRQQAKANIDSTLTGTQGRVINNKMDNLTFNAMPKDIEQKQAAAAQNLDIGEQNLQEAVTKNKYLDQQLEVELAHAGSDAERAAIIAKYETRNQESGLATEQQARAASRNSMANQNARLAFDKAQAKAKAGSGGVDPNQEANARLMLTYRQQYAEATAAGDTTKMAELDAKLRTAQVSAAEMNSINSIFGTDRKGSNGYSEKFTPALVKELADVNSDSSAGIQQMMGNLKNSGFMVVNPDKPGERVQLNGKGYDAFQDFIARKSRSRIGLFGVDFDDIEADDGPDYLREFANEHLKGNPDWIAKGPKPK